MNKIRSNRAAERARWLAELGGALDIAQGLALDLADSGVDVIECDALAHRLGRLRAEVDGMRMGSVDEWPLDPPIWTNLPASRGSG